MNAINAWVPSAEDAPLLEGKFLVAHKGRWTVSIEWAGTAFDCRVILDGRSDVPVEYYRALEPNSMFIWAKRQMQTIAKRCGEKNEGA